MWEVSPELSGAPVPASGYVAWIPRGRSSPGLEAGQGEDELYPGPLRLPSREDRTGSACMLSPKADLIDIPVHSDSGPHSFHLCSGLGSGTLGDFRGFEVFGICLAVFSFSHSPLSIWLLSLTMLTPAGFKGSGSVPGSPSLCRGELCNQGP